MRTWPVNSKIPPQEPPKSGSGSFWEQREDRFHCGIDIYAPVGTDVFSIEKGVIIDTGIFTSPTIHSYWNTTYYVLILHASEFFIKYAELGSITVNQGDSINGGDKIGSIGQVLNIEAIIPSDPAYIQSLGRKNPSMLHIELYKENPLISHDLYQGGNWFGPKKPSCLQNPYDLLHLLHPQRV